MSADGNVAPVIIKKVKKGGGDGHHGGAWKVAYADFVTAMMAFFLLMWLLNATTEKQRKGIADYFTPTIAIARVSGGGSGALNGDSVMAEATMAQNGRGATTMNTTESQQSRGLDGQSGQDEAEEEAFKELEEQLMGRGGESLVAENALKHIITRVTDEGLVIEVFSREGRPLFEEGTTTPTPLLTVLAQLIHGVSKAVTNEVAVEGHVASEPIVKARSEVWETSAERADVMRELLVGTGMRPERVRRVTGHADREPAVPDLMATRNDRLEIILLRNVDN